MEKRIAAHILAGGVFAFLGALYHDFIDSDTGAFLTGVGIVYAGIHLLRLVVPLYNRIKPKLDSAADDKARSKAYEELVRLKNLLDEKIITQAEFDTRSRELKSKIL